MIVTVYIYLPNGEVSIYPGSTIISTWRGRLRFFDRLGKEMMTTLPFTTEEE